MKSVRAMDQSFGSGDPGGSSEVSVEFEIYLLKQSTFCYGLSTPSVMF